MICSSSSSTSSHQPQHAGLSRPATFGDIVTVDLDLTPENGFVPERLFDTTGRISFVLGWGNYLPGLHELLQGLSAGDSVSGISIDAGWGERNPDLVLTVPKSNLKKMQNVDRISKGSTLKLNGGSLEVQVIDVTSDSITVDANPPLAGSSYSCSLTVVSVDSMPESEKHNRESPFQKATFALGCFWGGELAFMRTKGVVGTKVGYTQGVTVRPSYEEVCQGTTPHREAILVVYDTRQVSYQDLLVVYMERLAATLSQYKINMTSLFEEDEEQEPSSNGEQPRNLGSGQYQHGIYFHNSVQRKLAEEAIIANGNRYKVELKESAVFYDAESYHQQYLLKGGQSARKGAKEIIRCFG